MRTIEKSTQFKKDYRKASKSIVNQGLMNDLVSLSVALSLIKSFPKVLMTMR
jgi:mRNA-degrading endonuclease YafQ of YafQ-DinJ toxin-antitoxin module